MASKNVGAGVYKGNDNSRQENNETHRTPSTGGDTDAVMQNVFKEPVWDTAKAWQSDGGDADDIEELGREGSGADMDNDNGGIAELGGSVMNQQYHEVVRLQTDNEDEFQTPGRKLIARRTAGMAANSASGLKIKVQTDSFESEEDGRNSEDDDAANMPIEQVDRGDNSEHEGHSKQNKIKRKVRPMLQQLN